MAFTQSTFASTGAHSGPTPNVYAYSTEDAIVDVIGAGYFDPKKFQLEPGDLINAQCVDGYIQLEVTASTDTVEVSQNTIVDASSSEGSTDFNDSFYSTLRGIYKVASVGASLDNTPFNAVGASDYQITIRSETGNEVVKQLMTVKGPEWGGTRRFVRMGYDADTVTAEPWVELLSGVVTEEAVQTADNISTPILTIPVEDDEPVLYEYLVRATRAGGAFAGRFAVLVTAALGTAAIIQGQEVIYQKTSDGGLLVTAVTVGSDLVLSVRGKTGQDWDWSISVYRYDA